jgi:hypothetical protein
VGGEVVNVDQMLTEARQRWRAMTPEQRAEESERQRQERERLVAPELFFSVSEMRERLLAIDAEMLEKGDEHLRYEKSFMSRSLDKLRVAQALSDLRYCQDEREWWRRGLRLYRAQKGFYAICDSSDDNDLGWWIARQSDERLLECYERLRALVEGDA